MDGKKNFNDVLDAYSRIYAEAVLSNRKKWGWNTDIYGGGKLTPEQKAVIRAKQ